VHGSPGTWSRVMEASCGAGEAMPLGHMRSWSTRAGELVLGPSHALGSETTSRRGEIRREWRGLTAMGGDCCGELYRHASIPRVVAEECHASAVRWVKLHHTKEIA
jgi:hypothetical protein